MSDKRKPELIYVEGLLGIAEKNDISIKEATEIALRQLRDVGGNEHVEPTNIASE